MIDDNWDLFYKSHQTKDLLIVDTDAVVTEVAGEPPVVTGATIEIHTDDIKLESFDLDESLCSEENLKFGKCESSILKFNMRMKNGIPNLKSTEYSSMLDVYIYFNGDSSTLMQIGQYVCEKDQHTINRKEREIELYDVLYELWDFDITEWYYNLWTTNNSITIKNFRDSLFAYLLDEFDFPVVQAEATLILDDKIIVKSIESDVITFGFIMEGLLEVNGVFGHINRIGEFEYVSLDSYDQESVAQITDDFRLTPTDYEDFITWGIGFVIAYDQNNMQIGKYGTSSRKRPSTYTIIDNWVYDSFLKRGGADISPSVTALQQKIVHTKYKPCEVKTAGNPCLEVGDKIDVVYKTKSGATHSFYTYILERHLKGFGTMIDEFSARGNKKQRNAQIDNSNWHEGDSQNSATTGSGSGGVSDLEDEDSQKFVETIRNIGFRLLDEPSGVEVVYNKEDGQVEIKWTDPSDISEYEPTPCTWAGTVLVRKENNPPKHIWDGTILTTSTTRDAYSSNAYVDSTISQNKRYYYGIFPYHIALADSQHPINHYRFTKVVSVDTEYFMPAAEIESLEASGISVTVEYDIPEIDGLYSYCTLVYKKDYIPTDVNDGETVSLNESQSIKVISGLDMFSRYYFVIFTADTDGNTAVSEPKNITTGDAVWDFDYTGDIQTFVVPKSGVYSLETWGAQGDNAVSGSDNARGGYGAYAYGEIQLNQGDVLYIGVGGQEGYNGGGQVVEPDVLTPTQRAYFELSQQDLPYNEVTFSTPTPADVATGTYTLARLQPSQTYAGISDSWVDTFNNLPPKSGYKTTKFHAYERLRVMIYSSRLIVQFNDQQGRSWNSWSSKIAFGSYPGAGFQCGGDNTKFLFDSYETGTPNPSFPSSLDGIFQYLAENFHFFDLYLDGTKVNPRSS